LVYYGNRLIKLSFPTFHITNTLTAANIARKTWYSSFTKLRKVHNEKDKFLKIIRKKRFFLALSQFTPPRQTFLQTRHYKTSARCEGQSGLGNSSNILQDKQKRYRRPGAPPRQIASGRNKTQNISRVFDTKP
jgi:hypothetical protein